MNISICHDDSTTFLMKNIHINIFNENGEKNFNNIINLFTLKTSLAVAEPGLHKNRSKTESV